MAGGQGSRFWPVSRRSMPKQFLSISSNGESLIAATARRARALCKTENLHVVTNLAQRKLVEQHVPEAGIICEPVARNTAAAIGYAALHVRKASPDAVMVVLAADHAVKDEAGLCRALSEAVEVAGKQDALVTIGIKPEFPHTGYGYIKRGKKISGRAYEVARFFEKPSAERARSYMESGEYFWNSGMFAWKAEVILRAIEAHMPELHAGLMRIDRALGSSGEAQIAAEVFAGLDCISIDFGVVEHARNCCMIAAEPFGWSDVGSWDAWSEHFHADKQGNLALGDALLVDCKNCVVRSEKRFTAVVGGDNLIIIDSGDALLVCPRGQVQDVKKVVDELKRLGREELI